MTHGSLCPSCAEGTLIDWECRKCGAVVRLPDRDLMTARDVANHLATAKEAIARAKAEMPLKRWKAPEQ